MAGTLLLRSATLPGGSSCAGIRLTADVVADVRVTTDRVLAIDPPGTPATGADVVLDLHGYVLMPAPAEPHAHLDTALAGDVPARRGGDFAGAVRAKALAAPSMTPDEVLHRARRLALTYAAHGTTALRSHLDVGDPAGLARLEALLTLRRELTGTVALQFVARTAAPTTGRAGAENRALLRRALALGADVVGGSPHRDADPRGAVREALHAAIDAGVPVDLHVGRPAGATAHPAADSAGDGQPALAVLAELAHQVTACGFPHAVTASCVRLDTLAGPHPDDAKRLAADLAAAGVRVVVLPRSHLHLAGRDAAGAGGTGGTSALRTLVDAGVVVGAGSDHVRDRTLPMGRADPLETASLLVDVGQLDPEEAFTAITAGARIAMGLPAVPWSGMLRPGAPAELVAVRAASLRDAIAGADADRTVISGGRVVVRTRVNRTFPWQGAVGPNP